VNPLRRFFRLFWLIVTVRRRPRIALHDVARMNGRVWPSDLDELGHVNNGVYLSMLDHPRLDLLQRSGVWGPMKRAGIYAVVASQTVTYRKSMRLGQKFVIESRIIGYDDRAVYLDQRFVVDGEIYARAYVKGRFIRRTGGVVSTVEVGALTGIDVAAHPVPEWMADWARHVALPSTRGPAPSDWD